MFNPDTHSLLESGHAGSQNDGSLNQEKDAIEGEMGSQVCVVCCLLKEVWLQSAHHRVLHPDQHILHTK